MEPCAPREPMVARVWRLVREIPDPTAIGDLECPSHTDTDLKHGDILRLKSNYDRNFGLSVYDADQRKFVSFGVCDDDGNGSSYTLPPQFNPLDDERFCPTYWFAAHTRPENRGLGDIHMEPNTDDLTWCTYVHYDFSAFVDRTARSTDADGHTCLVIDHPRGPVTIVLTDDDDTDLATERIWRVSIDHVDVPTGMYLYA